VLVIIGTMPGLLITLVVAANTPINALEKAFVKNFLNPTASGYSQSVAISTSTGRTIYVSGQVGAGPKGIPDSISMQAELAFRNLSKQLSDAQAHVDDVVKLNIYIKNMRPDRIQAVADAKAKSFKHQNQPAATWIGVSELGLPKLDVEIEAVAIAQN
jgi:2-iminobutanoate/2-iminopropanoate deaminase